MTSAGTYAARIAAAAATALAGLGSGQTTAAAQSAGVWTDRGFDASFKASARERRRAAAVGGAAAGAAAPVEAPRLFAGLALMTGYDSNVDLDTVDTQRGAFGLAELGIGALWAGAASETIVLARGTLAPHDIDYRPERWEAGVLADHHRRLGQGWKVTAGGYFQADRIDADANDRTAGYLALNRETEGADHYLRLRTLDRDYRNAPGSRRPGGVVNEIDETMSNVRTEASAGVLLAKESRIAPFAEAGAATVEFTRPDAAAGLDRDGREVWALAGVRVTITPELRVDVGARVNHRDLDDTRIDRHTAGFFDGRVVWTPSERVYVEVNVDRTFEDPEAAGALLSERTGAMLYAEIGLDARTTAILAAGLVRLDQVGVDRRFDDAFLDLKLEHALSDRVALIGTAGVAASKDTADDDTAHRVRVGLGMKVGY